MKAIIFDLDNTLFDTSSCDVYLRSRAGREVICDLLTSNKVTVTPADTRIVEYINLLINRNCLAVYVFSDSPKDYCETILDIFGLAIHKDNVFGSQHKPCIEYNSVFSDHESVLVIGDSPKDIYFGHLHDSPTIFFTPLTTFDVKYVKDNAQPTAVSEGLDSLASKIADFYNGELTFKKPEIISYFKTASSETSAIRDIPDADVGYSREYVPDSSCWRNDIDKYTWFDVRRIIKPSKDLTVDELKSKKQMLFYNKDGSIRESGYLHRVAYHYSKEFKDWVESKKITGTIALVAAPASVPSECNKSFPMYQVAEWWSTWFYMKHKNGEVDFTIQNLSCVERFWPTTPAHMSEGARSVLPHLDTLGVFANTEPFEANIAAIVILDDIVTSRTQMKAVATLLQETGMNPQNIPIYGYALAKTHRPDSSLKDIFAAFSVAEKAGG